MRRNDLMEACRMFLERKGGNLFFKSQCGSVGLFDVSKVDRSSQGLHSDFYLGMPDNADCRIGGRLKKIRLGKMHDNSTTLNYSWENEGSRHNFDVSLFIVNSGWQLALITIIEQK